MSCVALATANHKGAHWEISGSASGDDLGRGQKLNTNFFICKLFGHRRDIPAAKSRDIPPKKFDFPGFEGHTELFGPHPFTWKAPTPPENIRTQKFGFVLFFRAWSGGALESAQGNWGIVQECSAQEDTCAIISSICPNLRGPYDGNQPSCNDIRRSPAEGGGGGRAL